MVYPKRAEQVVDVSRGRPKKVDAMTGAERARRYRAKQKAVALIKSDVTENVDPIRIDELTELLRKAVGERDYFKAEVRRLERANDELLARTIESERFHTITQKDLIVVGQQLAELQRQKVTVTKVK